MAVSSVFAAVAFQVVESSSREKVRKPPLTPFQRQIGQMQIVISNYRSAVFDCFPNLALSAALE